MQYLYVDGIYVFMCRWCFQKNATPKVKPPNPGVFVSNGYVWPWQSQKRCMSLHSTKKTVRQHVRDRRLVPPVMSSSLSRSPWCCHWTDRAVVGRVMTRWCVKKVARLKYDSGSSCVSAAQQRMEAMFESWHCLEQLASSLWDIGLWCVYWCVSVPLKQQCEALLSHDSVGLFLFCNLYSGSSIGTFDNFGFLSFGNLSLARAAAPPWSWIADEITTWPPLAWKWIYF